MARNTLPLRQSPDMATQPQYYQHHVFFCLNQREPGADRPSCANCNAQAMQEYAKAKVKQLGLAGPGKVRVNKAGCLDRCEQGPVVVIYPEGTWYTYIDESDIDEIVEKHLAQGEIVERLLID
ncbi:Ferredoxin, 2Fe-2S [Pandoraea soli]|uniref:Ferredoxin, 2Fe-2S n=2 Tax=Pandoraea soli TaxID=2508293 RepID=A0ABY6VTQ5_9BURK|nr:Ferredoxin, 2Fe-2S [Pandoraea soli]